MSAPERVLTCAEAIREALQQEMERDPAVVVMGMGVDDPKGIFGTTKGLVDRFGSDRVFDTPLSEDGMTGVAIGAALAGLKPVHVHIRMDFLLLAANQVVNMAAKARYMWGGQVSIPIVIRAVIGRSWGQGPQHSQALHSFFMHVPGIKVVAPTTPYDAKGILIQAIRDRDPVLVVEHRMAHVLRGPVPEEPYTVPFGKARTIAEGGDITIVGVSHMTVESLRARTYLEGEGIRAEVIDCLSLSPLDADTIAASVEKTGRLLVVDTGWTMCGTGAEVLARMAEREHFRPPPMLRRMGFAPVTCPTTKNLENLFYPDAEKIAAAAYAMVRGGDRPWSPERKEAAEILSFKGPF
jgi:acetoin:2,6-dichlorophenolindophenol oxidoreductase subunit beta